jgi:RHS repeat-associated protein
MTARRLVLLLVLLGGSPAGAGTAGPPGASTGDSGTPFVGLALAPEARLVTGAATTALPIDVPPGRGAMTPGLRLVYSSQGTPGPYGVGWDLPLGRIERSTRTGVPGYTDADEFLLLLPDGGGDLVRLGGDAFALRIDDAHVDVHAVPGTNAWSLRDRSGRVYEFGGSPEARVGPDPTRFDGTFAWHLTRVRDPNGNTIDLAWAQPAGTGVAYPVQVAWGGNVVGLAHLFTVTFGWQPAPGARRVSYAAGFRRTVEWALADVTVRYGDAVVRRYDLAQRPSATAGQPLLRSIVLRGADLVPLRRGDGSLATAELAYEELTGFEFPAHPRHADVAVDYFRDTDDCTTREFLDLDGDGRPDLVRTHGWSAQNKVWKVYRNLGRDAPALFATTPIPWPAPLHCISERRPDTNATFAAVVDVDGDGRPDYVDARTHPWKVHRNTGTGFATQAESWGLGGATNIRNASTVTGGVTRDLVDLNGDGRPESVYTGNWTTAHRRWSVQWNTGHGFTAPEEIWAPHGYVRVGGPDTPEMNVQSDLFDVNGDGLPDKVSAVGNPDGAGWRWRVWYGTGRGFTGRDGGTQAFWWDSPQRAFLRSWDGAEQVYRYDVLDVTGDGLPDFVDASQWTPGHAVWHVHVNTGQGFAPGQPWPAPAPLRRKSPDTAAMALAGDTFDVDGDGYPDVVALPGGPGNTTAEVWLAHPGRRPADVLTTIVDSLGAVTTFDYAVSTDFPEGPVDPALPPGRPHLPFPVHVVAAIRRLDPGHPEAPEGTTYRYRGGYYDGARREFRGFHVVFATDDWGATRVTQFHQTDALRGRPYREATYARDPADASALVDETWSAWRCEATSDCTQPDLGARWFPTLSARIRGDHSSVADLPWHDTGTARAVYSAFLYDACGNPVREAAVDDTGATTESTASFARVGAGCSPARTCAGVCDRAATVAVTGGVAKAFVWDGAGNLVRATVLGPGNPTTTMTYDGIGNLVAVTDPRGVVTTTTYDPATRIYPRTVVRDASGLAHTTTLAHDPRFGMPLARVESSGARTEWAYDAFGRLAAVAGPGQTLAQPGRTFAYTLGGGMRVDTLVLESTPAPHWLVGAAFHDALGRPLQTQVTRRVDGVARTVVTDAVRRGAGGRVVFAWAPAVRSGDPRTRVALGESDSATVFLHDALGRTLVAVAPDRTITTRSYADAWVVRACDARHVADPSAGRCVEEEVDGFARVVARRTYLGAATTPYTTEERAYDRAGRPTRVRQNGDPATDVVTTWDALGRRVAVADPDSGLWRFGYDLAGNLVYRDDPEPGRHLEMEYDALGRLVRRVARAADAPGEGAATVVAEHFYDTAPGGVGRLARVVDRSGETRFEAYDARGNVLRVTKVVAFDGAVQRFTTTSTFDDTTGRLASTTVPWPDARGEETIRWERTPEGTLQAVRSDHGTYLTDVRLDALGRITDVAYGNGLHDTFLYGAADDGHRLREIATGRPGESPLRDVRYQAYDENGNLRAVRDLLHTARRPESATLYAEYDDASRLRRAIQCGAGGYASAFGWDAAGNLIAKDGLDYGRVPGRPHQVASVGDEPVAYDAAGNATALPGDRTLVWDAEGHLVEVRRGGAVVATYLYDWRGERVAARTAEGTTFFFDDFDVRDGVVVRHVRADGRVIASSPVAAGWTLARGPIPAPGFARGVGGLASLVLLGFAFAPGRRRLGPFGRVRRGWAAVVACLLFTGGLPVAPARAQCDPTAPPPGTLFLHPDHLGGPQLVTDAQGRVVERRVERPWGGTAGVYDAGGEAKDPPASAFGFTGHRADDGTGLLYFGARWYDPALGAFVSHDPARQFASPYAYGDGNPLGSRDPTGMFIEGFILALIIGFALGAIAGGVQAAVDGASGRQAFQAALLGGLLGAGGSALGFVGGAAAAAVSPALEVAFRVAVASYGLYTTADSFRNGRYVQAGLAVIRFVATALRGGTGTVKSSDETSPDTRAPGERFAMAGGGADVASDAGGEPPASGALGLLAGVVGKAWNAPNTLIGLVFGFVGLVIGAPFGARVGLGANGIDFTGNPLLSLFAQSDAITIGNTTSYGAGFPPSEPLPGGVPAWLHELQHTFQGEALGPLYLPAHVILGAVALARTGSWHAEPNLLERGPQAIPPRPWW